MSNKNCIKCDQEINPLRLKALPGTKTCVGCSTTGAKKGIIVTLGEKDHTCNEVMFLEPEEYNVYSKLREEELKLTKEEEEEEEEDESTGNISEEE